MKQRLFIAVFTLLMLMSVASALADDQPVQVHRELPAATTRPAKKKAATRPTSRPATPDLKKLLADLTSTDKTRVTAALTVVHQFASMRGRGWTGPAALQILMQAKRYDDAETMSLACIIEHPDQTAVVGQFLQIRIKAFLADENNEAALETAKGYYNVVPFSQTKDAIDFLTIILPMAKPDDKSIGHRFREQQLADPSATPPADAGDPVLAAIKVDDSPWADANAKKMPFGFIDYLAKANLLLLSDRPDEARDMLEIGMGKTKRASELTAGIEGVARCIRAAKESIGPANDYLQSVQEAQK